MYLLSIYKNYFAMNIRMSMSLTSFLIKIGISGCDVINQPCLHGGTCTAANTCVCVDGYSGILCEISKYLDMI